jgi:hypothetical protein
MRYILVRLTDDAAAKERIGRHWDVFLALKAKTNLFYQEFQRRLSTQKTGQLAAANKISSERGDPNEIEQKMYLIDLIRGSSLELGSVLLHTPQAIEGMQKEVEHAVELHYQARDADIVDSIRAYEQEIKKFKDDLAKFNAQIEERELATSKLKGTPGAAQKTESAEKAADETIIKLLVSKAKKLKKQINKSEQGLAQVRQKQAFFAQRRHTLTPFSKKNDVDGIMKLAKEEAAKAKEQAASPGTTVASDSAHAGSKRKGQVGIAAANSGAVAAGGAGAEDADKPASAAGSGADAGAVSPKKAKAEAK